MPNQLLIWQSREIRLFSVEPDGSMLHLDKVTNDALDSLHVPFSWSNSETRHSHDSSGYINSSKGYRPLEGTNE